MIYSHSNPKELRAWRIGAGLLFVAFATGGLLAQAKAAAVETTIGVEGVYFVRSAQGSLAARPVDEKSPLVLRIAGKARDGNETIYELRYIATRSGEHDLRDYLAVSEGQAPLPPLLISVREVLPADHDGTLAPLAPPASRLAWPYRLTMAGLFAVWAAVSLPLLIRRLAKRRARPSAAPIIQTSLADELRPLVEAALANRLPPSGLARLESLLMAHWRDELQLGDVAPDAALRRMRSHSEAGRLLRELERWLHERPGIQQVDVAELLRPYRAALPCAARPLATAGVA